MELWLIDEQQSTSELEPLNLTDQEGDLALTATQARER